MTVQSLIMETAYSDSHADRIVASLLGQSRLPRPLKVSSDLRNERIIASLLGLTWYFTVTLAAAGLGGRWNNHWCEQHGAFGRQPQGERSKVD